MDLRRVVVTGASTGIGAATVRRFRGAGWEVVAVARRQDRLRALAAETGCRFVTADLTDPEAVRRLARETGPLDALVNDAGGARGADSVESGSAEDWRWMFEANVIATQQVTAALLPLLRAGAAAHGVADVVTVTSVAATAPYEGGAGYNAAKAAEHMLVAVLRLELAGEPIRVIEVAPGMVRTEEFSLNRLAGDREKADAVYAGVADPLSADDVAESIVAAVLLPAHVNLDLVSIRPLAQASVTKVVRHPLEVRRS